MLDALWRDIYERVINEIEDWASKNNIPVGDAA
jgi:hypothetical protein